MPLANLSPGNLAYLAMVLTAFVGFMLVLGATWAYVNLGAGKTARRVQSHEASGGMGIAAE